MPVRSEEGGAMSMRTWKWIAALALAAAALSGASAKKKDKVYLPSHVLKAQTVLVVILPGFGEPLNDITANRKAQEEVEKAFLKWGRYRLALDADQADLVVRVRKGTGKVANPTINGGPVDSRPGTIETTDGQIRIGVQQGHPPDVSDAMGSNPANDRVHTGMEVDAADDTLQVFQGGVQYPLDNPAVWKFTAKDGLKPPAVAAVEQFRKAVEESEKAAQQKQQAQQQSQQPGQKKSP
jgi:hypothetical protein